MASVSDVTIIGAGPYGLSIAAHLRALPLNLRIFGSPMHSWRVHAPPGMRLKSEGFASDLYSPDGGYKLSDYCADQGLAYSEVGAPISVETFIGYGLEFQRRYVPHVEDQQVIRLERSGGLFELWLDSGERVLTRKVVLATGLGCYASVPPELAGIPKDKISHSWDCGGFGRLAGRRVAVIGGGASALNSAASLLQHGASVTVLARRPSINFQSRPDPRRRPLKERMRWPQTGLGTGWKSVACVQAPLMFHRLPQQTRHRFVRRHLGPAPGWFVREQVGDAVQYQTGVSVERVEERAGSVQLHLVQADGGRRIVEADHVVAATGFDIDVRRVPFLPPGLLAELQVEDCKPALSASFESSIPGLYFVGTAASFSFGPLLRFSFGAHFTARQLARHLAPAQSALQRFGPRPARRLSQAGI